MQHSSEKEYQTQIFNGGDNTIFDHDGLDESPMKDHEQPGIEEFDEGDEDDSDYDGEEEEIIGENSNMIIIDQKGKDELQRKVVYLSNINSCSLPQSPKPDNNQESIHYLQGKS